MRELYEGALLRSCMKELYEGVLCRSSRKERSMNELWHRWSAYSGDGTRRGLTEAKNNKSLFYRMEPSAGGVTNPRSGLDRRPTAGPEQDKTSGCSTQRPSGTFPGPPKAGLEGVRTTNITEALLNTLCYAIVLPGRKRCCVTSGTCGHNGAIGPKTN